MNWNQLKNTYFPGAWTTAHPDSLSTEQREWPLLRSLRNRAICGVLILLGLFLVYRAVWMTGWYWPYRMLREYLNHQLPTAANWTIEMFAMLLATLIAAQAAAILSFVLFGKHKREMLYLSLAAVVIHGLMGWYSHERVVVDDQGRVNIRIVERSDGTLKVIDRPVDPETGQSARMASEADLVMLDFQRRGWKVRKIGRTGPFRTPQGTINVYWTRADGRLVLYSGPRHPDVSGDMPRVTDEILREFLQQR